ncbi:hypothetical protein ASG11_12420 [Sphingomonas sp. Leaf357]|uniref:PEPxxWA-CTERM sorting domain-containing protein n=1 Tax=Sphingomonas sp. Leaf357 TaxID=1736350 RepID=UPI0006F76D2C|nr:PEPxxWA-CTERM sorting domain-containing protein [Sphingomonas sp. Leaf357]KQS04956.1 hypothetical protein ASG11_12420 [Sphingomonas sp. Leaf357]
MSFMSKIATAAAVAAFTVAAAPAANAAVVYTVIGDTSGGPVFNRPTTLTSTSAVGTAVAYNTFLFSPLAGGSYTFLLTSTTALYDPFLALYAGAFNPASPLTNLVAFNDDLSGSLTQSGFTFTLDPSVTYTAVITGFDNQDFGTYNLTIATAAVPEPATWGLMVLGFGMVGAAARKRNVKTTVKFA